MPYIKLEDRAKFEAPVTEVLSILGDGNDTLYVKGEHFGFFVNRLCLRFLADPNYTNPSFNSSFFADSKKKTLSNAADSIAAMINRGDPIGGAGELNYAISAVLWGFLGEAAGFPKVGYGLRSYLTGILEKIRSTVESTSAGTSQRDMTMGFRRHLVIRGVLTDVISETYRVSTAGYEDGKRLSNGSLWSDGELVVERAQFSTLALESNPTEG